jgi:DNA-directed RNA polymerase sigma subunit (sigma70/sigma32)
MASNPGTRNRYEEFRENYTERGYAPTPTQELFQDFAEETEMGKEDLEMVEALIDMALQVMTTKQRKVWRYLLSDTYYTTTDIAEILSVKRQVVEEIRDTGLKRVRKYFEAGA